MSGDYTRFTFNPAKTFSGVLKQQGRVSLDSEYNEQGEILDRRNRAATYDIVDRPIVGQAVVPSTTPDGFKIAITGGQLTVGIGRAYVDGIQAECFGDLSNPATTVRNDRIGGVVGNGPVRYTGQPFFYTPAYPALTGGSRAIDLVYLDVWQREVTVFEDPALREPALDGPDTATRVQTAWQVKIMSGADAASCATPPAKWADLTAAATARMTAQTVVLPLSPGPCVINPAGGYTGLENRLYRVEIHRGGTLGGSGPAQFKWSRDNASLNARVKSIVSAGAATNKSTITVTSTGHDEWMRFDHGDRIELLDDFVEFSMRESGIGGSMATVLSANHATGELLIDADLSAFVINPDRHPRIRRWDYATPAEPLVRGVNNGTAIALEEGITVTFGPGAADTLHAGDYWVFAARTADGKIDDLVNAPPRGILHHFARLALVRAGVVISDCRIPWLRTGQEGCCTVVVKPGESIQDAINSLTGKGGCVCLKMGVHTITAPLHIAQSDVTLHGEVPWVTVRMTGGPQMLEIGAPGTSLRNINVEGILFEAAAGTDTQPMIRVTGVTDGSIARCGLRIAAGPDLAIGASGIALAGCHEFSVCDCSLNRFRNGIAGSECDRIAVVDNTLAGPRWEYASGQYFSAGAMGIAFDSSGGVKGVRVERNLLTDYLRGIQLGTFDKGSLGEARTFAAEFGCRIASNRIRRQPSVMVGAVPGAAGAFAFAIGAHVSRCDILENAIEIPTFDQGGILVYGGDVLVARNELRSSVIPNLTELPQHQPYGVIAFVGDTDALMCMIRDNLFTGMQLAVFAAGSPKAGGPGLPGFNGRVEVIANRILGSEHLIRAVQSELTKVGGDPLIALLTLVDKFSSIAVTQVEHSRIADNEISTVACGVFATLTSGTSIMANRVSAARAGVVTSVASESETSDNIITATQDVPTLAGVLLLAATRCVAARNVTRDCGLGIVSALTIAQRIADNDVHGGDIGIGSLLDTDLQLCGNNVQEAATKGIGTLFAIHEIAVAHNRTLRCGYRQPDLKVKTPDPAIGIEVFLTFGIVNVDSCHVIDTGDPAAPSGGVPAPGAFAGPRYGILAAYAFGVRVHGCTVASAPGPLPHPATRALRILLSSQAVLSFGAFAPVGATIPYADATDNVIEQPTHMMVEISVDGPNADDRGDVMFATNRCTNFNPDPQAASVELRGGRITATGNQVRSGALQLSLNMTASRKISAVGNMTTRAALATAPVLVPSPYPNFNAMS